MQAQIPFPWQRRLGQKTSVILEVCEDLSESNDPLWTFWDWADVQAEVAMRTGKVPSKGAVTGHLSNLEKWGFIARIDARNYERTRYGERWYTLPERVDEANDAVLNALWWLERIGGRRYPADHESFIASLARNAKNPRFQTGVAE